MQATEVQVSETEASLIKKINVHDSVWELLKLKSSISGHKIRPDGIAESSQVRFVLKINDKFIESNENGDIIGFGSVPGIEKVTVV